MRITIEVCWKFSLVATTVWVSWDFCWTRGAKSVDPDFTIKSMMSWILSAYSCERVFRFLNVYKLVAVVAA